jgi:hypothetical protein
MATLKEVVKSVVEYCAKEGGDPVDVFQGLMADKDYPISRQKSLWHIRKVYPDFGSEVKDWSEA